MKALYFIVILVINQMKSQNICNLRIGDSELSALKGGNELIYNDGVINDQYKESSITPHISTYLNNIEYLYSAEYTKHSNHVTMTAKISSNDESVAKPVVEIKGEKGTDVFFNIIEIKYNCNPSKKGSIKIFLTIYQHNCQPFSLHWMKICKEQNHIPNVNIGVTEKSTEIYKEGKPQNSIPVYHSSEDNFIIKKDFNTFTIYIAYASEGKNKFMKEPTLTYDSNAFSASVIGSLAKGGVLTNTPQQFTIVFGCTALIYTKSDVEISLNFQDNDIINLYFKKECDTVGDANEYFNFFYTIYWIGLTILIGFVITIFYYYLRRNELTLGGLLVTFIEKCKQSIYRITRPASSSRELHNDTRTNLYEENDLVDIKIKTDKKEFDKKEKFNNFTTDYGGI